MTQLIMCDRHDPHEGDALEAEPVVLELDGDVLTLVLDDGGELHFGAIEFEQAIRMARAEDRAA